MVKTNILKEFFRGKFMFKIKKIEIDAGHELNVALLKSDISELGLQSGDRVRVCPSKNKCSMKSRKFLVCELLIAKPNEINLKKGEAGIFNNVFEEFLSQGDIVLCFK